MRLPGIQPMELWSFLLIMKLTLQQPIIVWFDYHDTTRLSDFRREGVFIFCIADLGSDKKRDQRLWLELLERVRSTVSPRCQEFVVLLLDGRSISMGSELALTRCGPLMVLRFEEGWYLPFGGQGIDGV